PSGTPSALVDTPRIPPSHGKQVDGCFQAPAERSMRSLLVAISLVVFSQASAVAAQNPSATIRVQVRVSEKPVEGAEVIVAGVTYRTDTSGATTVTTAPGTVEVTVVNAGFAAATT